MAQDEESVNSNVDNRASRVLCIVARPDNSGDPMLMAAGDAGAEVETVADVYHGMARLADRRRTYDAVVVDVAALDAGEMEFFDLAARYHWRVPVYVFSRTAPAGGSPLVDAALIRGARAAVNAEELVRSLSRRTGSADAWSVPPEPSPLARQEEPPPAANRGAIDQTLEERLQRLLDADVDADSVEPTARADLDDEPEAAEEAGGSELPSDPDVEDAVVTNETAPADNLARPRRASAGKGAGARVPWRTYEESPQRVPPTRPKATPADVPRISVASPPDEPEPEPPLLTAEELNALMGSDAEGAPSDPPKGKAKR